VDHEPADGVYVGYGLRGLVLTVLMSVILSLLRSCAHPRDGRVIAVAAPSGKKSLRVMAQSSIHAMQDDAANANRRAYRCVRA
jgi:hypothetical protein